MFKPLPSAPQLPARTCSSTALFGTVLAAACLAISANAAAYCPAYECSLDRPGGDSCARDPETGCSNDGQQLVRETGCVYFAVQEGTAEDRVGLSDEDFEQAILEALEAWAEVDCGDGEHPSIEVQSAGIVDMEEPFVCLSVPELNVDTWLFTTRLSGPGPTTAHSGAIAGQTQPSFIRETGEIFDADVLLNELWFAVQEDDDLRDHLHVVAMHEAGHVLGLAHSFDDDALMYEDYRVTADRALTQDDIDGICALYPPDSELDCAAPARPLAAFSEFQCDAAHEEKREMRDDAATAADEGGCSIGSAHAVGGAGPATAWWMAAALLMLRQRWRSTMAARAGCLVVALSAACGGGAPQPPKAEPQAPSNAQLTPAMPADDAQLLARLEALMQTCELSKETEKLSCQALAEQQLGTELSNGTVSRIAALPTLVRALHDEDPKRRAIAAELLSLGLAGSLGDDVKPGAVDKAVTHHLLTALRDLPLHLARRIVGAATHAAVLSGQWKELYATLLARGEMELQVMALRRVSRYGRLGELPDLKAIASGESWQLAVAAIEAMRNMPDWTKAEQDAVCPWMVELVGHQDPARAARASQTLSNCEDEHVDALIERNRALHAEHKLDRVRVTSMVHVCGRPQNVTSGRCAATLTFLESLVDDRAASADLRDAAMSAIMHQYLKGPDPKRAKRLAQRNTADPDPEIAKQARRMLGVLERDAELLRTAAAAEGKPNKAL